MRQNENLCNEGLFSHKLTLVCDINALKCNLNASHSQPHEFSAFTKDQIGKEITFKHADYQDREQ